ncbi:MAG TPA: dTMP kinase [Rectinemataceae bacterium]|nr:dTMP kinase [Rectinemataceae bacterium]
MKDQERSVLQGFVVLEGIDGTGTTTQLRRLEAVFARRGIPAWTSFEPTELPTGAFVRRVLSGEVPALPGTIARLFAADRHEHLFGQGGAIERLERGELVVFDRYLFSSLAYQGMDCGMELPMLLNADFPLPELLLFFDLDVDTAMSRVAKRPGRDIYETHEALEKVREAYARAMAPFQASSMRIHRIDAALPLDEVSKVVDSALEPIVARMQLHFQAGNH